MSSRPYLNPTQQRAEVLTKPKHSPGYIAEFFVFFVLAVALWSTQRLTRRRNDREPY